jgi:cell division protein FtsA
MNERIVVGLDIGTTKVCAVVASVDDLGRINVLGMGLAASDGLNRGVVVNIDRTVAAVREAVSEAERVAGVRVQSVIVGIAGDHVQSLQSRGVVAVSNRDGEITEADVHRLLEDTTYMAMPTPADREILHVIPQDFIVDGQDGVADPVGMSGVRLEANVHIITGLVSAVKNIYRCIEKAGYQVADIVLEPLGSSFSVLHPDEKEVGVALIDIGGGTTDIAVFEDNTIRHTAVIAIAGNKVTDDIRKGLGVMRDQAERLKCDFGIAIVDAVDEDETISIPGIGGRPDKSIGRSTLAQIIQPRMEEILEIAGIEIERSKYMSHLSGGVVLTGGGSLIPGTAELAAEVLGMETRVGRPMGLGGGLVEEVCDPKFATAVGLVLYGLRPEMIGGTPFRSDMGELVGETVPGETLVNKIASRMKSWFDEL